MWTCAYYSTQPLLLPVLIFCRWWFAFILVNKRPHTSPRFSFWILDRLLQLAGAFFCRHFGAGASESISYLRLYNECFFKVQVPLARYLADNSH
jgi:hypothetical protein